MSLNATGSRLSYLFHSFFFSSYLLQLNVFFEELNYEVIEESIGYGVSYQVVRWR